MHTEYDLVANDPSVDNARAFSEFFQWCVDNKEVAELPSGNFYTNDTISVRNGSLNVYGEGSGFDYGTTSTNIISINKDVPIWDLSSIIASSINNLTLSGPNRISEFDRGSSAISDYISKDISNDSKLPQCGFSFDLFRSANRYRSFSNSFNNVTVLDCNVAYFLGANGTGNVNQNNWNHQCSIYRCNTAFATSQSQAFGNKWYGRSISNVHTVVDGVTYGMRQGPALELLGNEIGNVYQLFNVKSSTGQPVVVRTNHMEGVRRIGRIGYGWDANATPTKISDGFLQFELAAWDQSHRPENVLEHSGSVLFENMVLWSDKHITVKQLRDPKCIANHTLVGTYGRSLDISGITFKDECYKKVMPSLSQTILYS